MSILEISQIDLISFVSCPIEMLFGGDVVAHGTGFIWPIGLNSYLVTNWHNLTGKNPFSGALLSPKGSVPDTVRLHFAKRVGSTKDIYKERVFIDVPLYENFAEPFWFQHKNFSSMKTDIAILQLDKEKIDGSVNITDFSYRHLFSHVGSDVFIVGYPNKDFKDHMPPIWKRGSLASEPMMQWHGKPAFLIDAASRSGMSGSPIFRRVFGPSNIVSANGEITTHLDAVMTTDFIGIYSGHLSDIDEKLTIGIGWSRNIILEIIQNPVNGTRD